ncbi:hypothetical protein WJX84_007910 [Apatococcus fuscideae]|uniref:Magnesium transporter n=1 Tax=Apatococcus fuscideae TaxID=2026836 RepID=A0AAW1TFP7_9CHLO
MFGRQLSLNRQLSAFGPEQHASIAELSALNGGSKAQPETLPKTTKKLPTLLAARKWVRVNKQGEANVAQADKHLRHHLQQALGVQLRDLRILDPALATSYPSAILVREKALVVNLEHIKCVISTSSVYVLNADDENVIAFIEELQRRLVLVAAVQAPVLDGISGQTNGHLDLQKPEALHPHDEMPFELRVLEIALDVVCSQMERQTGDLEAAAHPALDGLTQRVTTQNLERVRRIKNRMVRLTTKVETIREVLEKFLDDDSDMKDMNLTAKEEEAAERASNLSLQRQSYGLDRPSFKRKSGGAEQLPDGSELGPVDTDSDSDSEVDEVEMVLEAYFMQLDNTYNKLQTLCEYIDDTEDYINIELDSQRNQLIRIDLLLTAATFCASIISVVTGIFGMNLNNTHEDSYTAFIATSAITSGGAVVVFISIVMYCRHKKLLSFV